MVLTVTYAISLTIRIAFWWRWCQQKKQLQVFTSLAQIPFYPLGFCCAIADCFYLVSTFIAEAKKCSEKMLNKWKLINNDFRRVCARFEIRKAAAAAKFTRKMKTMNIFARRSWKANWIREKKNVRMFVEYRIAGKKPCNMLMNKWCC